jgi:ATP-binding cassette, subfamily B, multidrug efflux pump
MRELFVLNKYFWKYRGRLLAGILFVILSNWFRALQPQLVRQAMDLVILNLRNLHGRTPTAAEAAALGAALSYFGLMILACAGLMGLFMFFMRQTIIVASRYIEYEQRDEIFAHFETLDTAFYKRNKVGDLMSRITEDVNKVRMYVGPALMYIVNTLALFGLVIYAMLRVSVPLTLLSLAPLPVLSVCIYAVSQYINQRSTAISRQLSTLTSIAQETFSGIRVLKTYTQEAATVAHFAQESAAFRQKSLALVRINAFFFPLVAFLVGLSTLAVVYFGGQQVFAAHITAGNIAEFIIYVGMLAWPVTSIGWVASLIQTAIASQRRINEFLQQKSTIAQAENGLQQAVSGDITFKNVSFVYPDTGIAALRNVSFQLKKGQKMAILGRTGGGKTTVAELLNSMYDATEGSILIDNVPIKDWHRRHLRQQIGYVPQDVFLFSDTVANNIAFGVSQLPQADIERFAQAAAIHTEITELPEGYQTIVGERGVTLSGGQKQRISIARALAKQPALLLLDDCLSAVDAATEQHILQHLATAMQGCTTILITHRVHYLHDFDHIIVLDEGSITEQGTPAELLANGGFYAEQYAQQSMSGATEKVVG